MGQTLQKKPKQSVQKKGNSFRQRTRKEKVLKKKERVRKNKKQLGLSIRVQLIVGFVIPIAFIIAVGFVSYSKASSGLTSNYEKSSGTALEMTVATLEESMKNIRTTVQELAQDTNVKGYALGGFKGNVTAEGLAKSTVQKSINVKATSNSMINNLYIIPMDGTGFIATKQMSTSAEGTGFISKMEGTEDEKMLQGAMVIWGSSHPTSDQYLEISPDEYIMYCSQNFSSGALKGVVLADIDRGAVKAVLDEMNFGDEAQVSFITAEGAELSTDTTDIAIAQTDFYKKGAESEENMITEYVNYEGRSYYFMMCKSETTGACVAVMVPKSVITASTRDIRQITLGLVLVACLIAALLSYVIITNITRNISGSVRKLDRVSQGELIEENGPAKKTGAEFGKLHGAISNTVHRMRELVLTVKKMIGNVSDSSERVSDSSRNVGEMVTDMSAQVQEILSTIHQEDEEIATCNDRMEELSVNIKTVSGSIINAIEEADASKQVIVEGEKAVEDMMRQSKETSAVTSEVQHHVTQLSDKLAGITKAVENIQEIASQTNLLSLNASIEAARAGEHGRGFSVVAEEIRKLADNSAKMADSIQNVIEEVKEYSDSAIGKVHEAETIVQMQSQSADNTASVFKSIDESMGKLVSNMEHVSTDVDEMNQRRREALHSIHVISQLSAGTVQAAKVVGDALERQIESANTLEGEARSLEGDMKELETAISTFKLVKGSGDESDKRQKKTASSENQTKQPSPLSRLLPQKKEKTPKQKKEKAPKQKKISARGKEPRPKREKTPKKTFGNKI